MTPHMSADEARDEMTRALVLGAIRSTGDGLGLHTIATVTGLPTWAVEIALDDLRDAGLVAQVGDVTVLAEGQPLMTLTSCPICGPACTLPADSAICTACGVASAHHEPGRTCDECSAGCERATSPRARLTQIAIVVAQQELGAAIRLAFGREATAAELADAAAQIASVLWTASAGSLDPYSDDTIAAFIRPFFRAGLAEARTGVSS